MRRLKFTGKLSDYNMISPKQGGKSYGLEVTLPDGSKAYTVSPSIYLEISPEMRSPLTPSWQEWASAIGRPVSGEYTIWKQMKVIVKLDDPY